MKKEKLEKNKNLKFFDADWYALHDVAIQTEKVRELQKAHRLISMELASEEKKLDKMLEEL